MFVQRAIQISRIVIKLQLPIEDGDSLLKGRDRFPRASDDRDPVTLVVQQLVNFSSGLDSIRDALAGSLGTLKDSLAQSIEKSKEVQVVQTAVPAHPAAAATSPAPAAKDNLQEVSIAPETLQKIWSLLEDDGHKVRAMDGSAPSDVSQVIIRLLGPGR